MIILQTRLSGLQDDGNVVGQREMRDILILWPDILTDVSESKVEVFGGGSENDNK